MPYSMLTFCKLFNANKSRIFRVKVEWAKDRIKIFILEGNRAWDGVVSVNYLKKFAEEFGFTIITYMKLLRGSLCSKWSHVTVDITPNSEFVIYRTIIKNKLQVKFLVVNLKKLEYRQCIMKFVDSLMVQYKDTCMKLLAVQKRMVRMRKEASLLGCRCKQLADMKIKAENKMYSTVAIMLNEKKKKIHHLTILLKKFQSDGGIKAATDAKPVKVCNDTKAEQPGPSTSNLIAVPNDQDSNPSDGNSTDNDQYIKSEKTADELDFLGGESPSSSPVSKRFKSDTDISLPMQPAVDNEPLHDCAQPEINSSKRSSQSPQHLDTQDLLDMM